MVKKHASRLVRLLTDRRDLDRNERCVRDDVRIRHNERAILTVLDDETTTDRLRHSGSEAMRPGLKQIPTRRDSLDAHNGHLMGVVDPLRALLVRRRVRCLWLLLVLIVRLRLWSFVIDVVRLLPMGMVVRTVRLLFHLLLVVVDSPMVLGVSVVLVGNVVSVIAAVVLP